MLKKKIIIILIILLLCLNFEFYIFAGEIEEETDYIWLEEEILETSSSNIKELKIFSKSAIVLDRTSKTVLWKKNENLRVPMASTTKIMTAVVLLEAIEKGDISLNTTVEVCKEAANIGGSRLGLKNKNKITINDLLYGLMLCSGNDCAIQIAVSVSESIENFAELMNNKAKELSLKNTHFTTPHGLDKEDHYTTAYELAIITDYALDIKKFAEIVNTKTYTVVINGYSKNISNTNELLGYLSGVNGVKTGFTNKAGRCLVTSANRDGFNIIVVVLGADTKKIRTKDSINLIEYIYQNYELVNLEQRIEEEFLKWKEINEKRICVSKGKKEFIKLKLEDNAYNLYPIEKSKKENIEILMNSKKFLEAPVYKNSIVGSLQIKINNTQIGKINIIALESVEKKNVIDYFKIILNLYFWRQHQTIMKLVN